MMNRTWCWIALLSTVVVVGACTHAGPGTPQEDGGDAPTPVIEPSLAQTLRVHCHDRRFTTPSDTVMATPRGVRARVVNETVGPLFLQYTEGRNGPWGGIKVGPGAILVSIQLPPGVATIRCSHRNGRVIDGGRDGRFTIVDGTAAFVPFSLECEDGPLALTPDVMPWSRRRAIAHDPVGAVVGSATGIRASDRVEVAGYRHAPEPTVRVVRGGSVVAAFDLIADGRSWSVSYAACGDAAIALRD